MVLCHLGWHEILRLRTTCRFFFHLIRTHSRDISQCIIRSDIGLSTAHRLFQAIVAAPKPSFNDVFGLSRRSCVVEHLARTMAEDPTFRDSYLISTDSISSGALARQIDIVADNLRPHLMIISHMLESYRSFNANLVQHNINTRTDPHNHHNISGMIWRTWEKQVEILKSYNEPAICRTSLIFSVLERMVVRHIRCVSNTEPQVPGVRFGLTTTTDVQGILLMILGGVEAINRLLALTGSRGRVQFLHKVIFQKDFDGSASRSALPCPLPHVDTHIFGTLDIPTIQWIAKLAPRRNVFFNIWQLNLLMNKNEFANERALTHWTSPLQFFGLLRTANMDSDVHPLGR